MYTIVWAFRVRANRIAEFERIYAGDGDWARLFARAQGFLGTALSIESGTGRYITVDCWTSQDAHSAFLAEFATEYATLDTSCTDLTTEETRLD
jgi:heme-degrading monooxygenase HmoA